MLDVKIKLETHLNLLNPTLATEWENIQFTPPDTAPYQRVSLIPNINTPYGLDPADGNDEIGIFQIDVLYKIGIGSYDIITRVEALMAHFSRGTSFVLDGGKLILPNVPTSTNLGIIENRQVYSISIDYLYIKD